MAKGNGVGDVLAKLAKAQTTMEQGAEVAAEVTEVELQSYAKQNRRWKDKTNVARNSITGSHEKVGSRIRVALAIGAFYGEYLELSNGGRFAIIEPTMQEKRESLARNVKNAIKL